MYQGATRWAHEVLFLRASFLLCRYSYLILALLAGDAPKPVLQDIITRIIELQNVKSVFRPTPMFK